MHSHRQEAAPRQRFDAFLGRVMSLYHDQRFDRALALLDGEGDEYADQAPMVLYLRACLAARLHDAGLAVRGLREAADRGFWYSERIMRESPSFRPLQGLPEFEALVPLFAERHAAVPREPRRLVLEPAGGNRAAPCPALLALHGNGESAADSLAAWRSVVDDGWFLAALQSSQVEFVDGYVWDDQNLAGREVRTHYQALRDEHPLDPGRIVLAGFSMGGVTALRLALDGSVPARGFILLGPAGAPMQSVDGWQPSIARGLRGCVILDANDRDIEHAAIHTLVGTLNANGIPCHLDTITGVGHGYPADLDTITRRALAFIENG